MISRSKQHKYLTENHDQCKIQKLSDFRLYKMLKNEQQLTQDKTQWMD